MQESLEWLYEWEYNSDGKKNYMDLPINIEKYFKKKNKNITIYRGLKMNDDFIKDYLLQFNDNINFEKYKLHSRIKLNLRDLTSWSTNIDIAKIFTIKKDYGILLQASVNPKDILVDIDLTLNDDRLQEIILKPGLYDVEIIDIINNKNNYNKDLSFGLYKNTNI